MEKKVSRIIESGGAVPAAKKRAVGGDPGKAAGVSSRGLVCGAGGDRAAFTGQRESTLSAVEDTAAKGEAQEGRRLEDGRRVERLRGNLGSGCVGHCRKPLVRLLYV